MTARDWLMRQGSPRRPTAGGLQVSEGFAALIDAVAAERASAEPQQPAETYGTTEGIAVGGEPPSAGPVATAAAAAMDAVEAYCASARVVAEETRPMLSTEESERLDSAFARRTACRVCDIRYSCCYPFNHGGGRG